MQKVVEVVGGNVPSLCKVKVDRNAQYAQESQLELKFKAAVLHNQIAAPPGVTSSQNTAAKQVLQKDSKTKEKRIIDL